MVSRTGKRLLAIVFSVFVAFAWLPARHVAAAGPTLERWGFYVTYDPSSRLSLVDHIHQLDTVVPNYYSLQADGTLTGTNDPAIDAIVVRAGKHLRPLVQNRVRNADLSPLLNDADLRQRVVTSITAVATTHDYDGLTLDFEGVSPGDRSGLSTFVANLADSLHARGKSLAVAIPAKSGEMSAGWAGGFDYGAIGASADRAILMAYAFRTAANPQPGPISPLPWVDQVTAYALSAIPSRHLILGIGAWGYDWNLTQGGLAQALRYDQTSSLMRRAGSRVVRDQKNASVELTYHLGSDVHEVWFEDAATIQQKISLAATNNLAGVAIWRLGQEAPDTWGDSAPSGAKDFAIPNGWYFAEAGGGSGLGYRVVDDANARLWTEFRRLGGVATLGYPCSRRFVGADGFTYQIFQRAVLQWRPERGQAYLANTFEQLTAAGRDSRLESMGIPPPILDDGSGGDWNRARKIRLSWLTNAAIQAAFFASPGPTAGPWSVDRSIQLYGLPSSLPTRSGPFVVQRFQRMSLQLWVEDVPGMPSKGSVVGILGGDLYKQAGLIPPEAAMPEPPFVP